MDNQKQGFLLYCRGKCTGRLVADFKTTEGLAEALNVVNNPTKCIEIINNQGGVQVKRPLLIVVN